MSLENFVSRPDQRPSAQGHIEGSLEPEMMFALARRATEGGSCVSSTLERCARPTLLQTCRTFLALLSVGRWRLLVLKTEADFARTGPAYSGPARPMAGSLPSLLRPRRQATGGRPLAPWRPGFAGWYGAGGGGGVRDHLQADHVFLRSISTDRRLRDPERGPDPGRTRISMGVGTLRGGSSEIVIRRRIRGNNLVRPRRLGGEGLEAVRPGRRGRDAGVCGQALECWAWTASTMANGAGGRGAGPPAGEGGHDLTVAQLSNLTLG